MVNLILFIVTLIVAFVVVRIGAVALHLTGLEWSIAKFQALSCFSGTGFTTKESELITRDPKRRRIATILMVVGNAGIVTLIATFANTIRPQLTASKIQIPYLHLMIPNQLLPIINLLVVFFIVFVIYKIFTHASFMRFLTEAIRKKIVKQDIINNVTLDDLLIATGGYSVVSVAIKDNSPVLDQPINKLSFAAKHVSILVLEREQELIPNPAHNIKIRLGDKIICFGKVDSIKNIFKVK